MDVGREVTDSGQSDDNELSLGDKHSTPSTARRAMVGGDESNGRTTIAQF